MSRMTIRTTAFAGTCRSWFSSDRRSRPRHRQRCRLRRTSPHHLPTRRRPHPGSRTSCFSPDKGRRIRARPTGSPSTTPGGRPTGRCSTAPSRAEAPATFGLDRVIPGWSEGVQLMVVGEKRRFWIPEALAYKGPADGPKGMLVFDVELMNIEPSPTAAPADVASATGRCEEDPHRPRLQGAEAGHRHGASVRIVARHRALHGLDDRRQDVRQLGRRAASPPRSV